MECVLVFILYEWMFIFYINIKHAFQICLSLKINLSSRSLVFCTMVYLSLTHPSTMKQKVIISNLTVLFLLLNLTAKSRNLSHLNEKIKYLGYYNIFKS